MKKLTVLRKSFKHDPQSVFDIEVQDEHHYILESGIVSHNSGPVYASDIVVSMNKRKLKTDEDGNKVTDVRGIRSIIKCIKTRYSKPFEAVEVEIPYTTGIDPYSGMFDLCEQKHVITKDGNRYRYVDTSGTEHKLYRKNMDANFFDMVIREWTEVKDPQPVDPQLEETIDVE